MGTNLLKKGGNTMTLLSGDMRKLADSLMLDYENRMQAVADLRTDVKSDLNNYRTAQRALSAEQNKALKQNMESLRRKVAEASQSTNKFLNEVSEQHQAMTAAQRQALADAMTDLRNQVANASQAAVDFLKEIDQEQKTISGEQRQRLNAEMDDLHNQVNDLRQAAANFLSDIDKSNQSMADELGRQLTSDRTQLSVDTASFINSASSAHQEMAAQQDKALSDHFANLQQSVIQLRKDASAFLLTTTTVRQSSAAAQKSDLVNSRNQLLADVGATRAKNSADMSALRADQAEASKLWAEISLLKQKGRGQKAAPAAPKAVVVAAPKAPVNEWVPAKVVEPKKSGVDDLQVIKGIGPGLEALIRAAGINTFAELAASSPEQLTEALGKNGKL